MKLLLTSGGVTNASIHVALIDLLGKQPVEMVTRKIRDDGDNRGMIVYGYKFKPVLASSH
jgi:hypothetical protein